MLFAFYFQLGDLQVILLCEPAEFQQSSGDTAINICHVKMDHVCVWTQHLVQTWSRNLGKASGQESRCAESWPSPTYQNIWAGSEPPSGRNGQASVKGEQITVQRTHTNTQPFSAAAAPPAQCLTQGVCLWWQIWDLIPVWVQKMMFVVLCGDETANFG